MEPFNYKVAYLIRCHFLNNNGFYKKMKKLIKKNVLILGLIHEKTQIEDGFTKYTINLSGRHVLHREDGQPAFSTSEGKKQFFLFGREVMEDDAIEHALNAKQQYTIKQISEF